MEFLFLIFASLHFHELFLVFTSLHLHCFVFDLYILTSLILSWLFTSFILTNKREIYSWIQIIEKQKRKWRYASMTAKSFTTPQSLLNASCVLTELSLALFHIVGTTHLEQMVQPLLRHFPAGLIYPPPKLDLWSPICAFRLFIFCIFFLLSVCVVRDFIQNASSSFLLPWYGAQYIGNSFACTARLDMCKS